MIVVDASALVEWLLRSSKAALVEAQIFDRVEPHTPHLVDIEVANALRRFVRLGDMTVERGRAALVDLADAPIRRVPHVDLLPRIWELRDNVSSYDAAYVALAEALDAVLVTLDGRLAKVAERWTAVHLI